MVELSTRYRILETDLGPMISDSRSSVFDVMEMEAKGYDVASDLSYSGAPFVLSLLGN